METIQSITGAKLKKAILSSIYALNVLLVFLLMGSKVWGTDQSILKSASFEMFDGNFVPFICMVTVIASFAVAGLSIGGIISALTAKSGGNRSFASKAVMIDLIILILTLALGNAFQVFGGGGKAAFAVILIVQVIGTAYVALCRLLNKDEPAAGIMPDADIDIAQGRFRKAVMVISTLSMLLLLSVFFVPVCSYKMEATGIFSVVPINFGHTENSIIIGLPVFIVMFLSYSLNFSNYLKTISTYKGKCEIFVEKAKKTVYGNTVIAALYFIIGAGYCFWQNIHGWEFSTVSFIPLILALATSVALAFVLGRYSDTVNIRLKDKKTNFRKIELCTYGIMLGIIALLSLVIDIVVVRFDITGTDISGIRLNGYNLLTMYPSLGAGFQLAAFFVFAFVVVSLTMTIIMLISLISRSKLFYKIAAFTVASNSLVAFAVGMFGKYYQIATKINEETVFALIKKYVNINDLNFKYTVTSQSFWLFLAAMAVLALALIRVPYTKGLEAQENGGRRTDRGATLSGDGGALKTEQIESTPDFFDACPAFTELDGKADEYALELRKRQQHPFERASLPSIVQFVVDYARDSRLHLSYTVEDIADFIAGLGAARLTILQGMSGTGKTSLPKIFAEALMGNCEIIEVESSWRDKNELLGYYNEFSKTYTPKKFTQALYKAKLNPDIVTLIVLDEMNLSRIEYYFSDFLSLMENEEGRREIKLLNVKLYNTVDGEKYSYSALSEDHTLKIPSNVWFVGTANRDESTFEISDKVYDRAHTMNFNTRAKKPASYNQPLDARYLSLRSFSALIESAKASSEFDIEKVPVIAEVEELLSGYNISFGNRIARQMEDFVKIYCACFYDGERMRDEAVEKILLSKVVSKLEYKNIDNKEALAVEFERLGLERCAAFVRKLNEE